MSQVNPDGIAAAPRHPDESQDPEPEALAAVTLGPDVRQDDGVGQIRTGS
ncbi:hypothetical protein SPHINGO391_430034 [Sphingomonas aurantiaca]|uniref:Uncharacterized protein n=1 Tax=Sphingomonas aurantiaca TaxID=185949 RepID=A0A5E7Z0N9_9SPHN|nr:hypothetical protein SPHINGO391_430034 [Sphingomonas aurantiaca]